MAVSVTAQNRVDVANLYVAFFGHAPDGVGLGFWSNLLANGTPLSSLADTMFATAPARAFYPAFNTNEQTIGSFYLNVLGRPADAEGLAFWTAKLNAPDATAGSVISEIISVVVNYSGTDAAGLLSQTLFANKADVALTYGLANGNIANAQTILSNVNATATSVAQAKAAIAAGAGVDGSIFTLTQGLDNLVGTVGNDTINAFAFNNVTGADTTTLQSVDNIDGGAGIDTLNIEVKDNGIGDFNNIIQGTIKNVEIININNTAANSAASVDATKLGTEATQIWQIGQQAAVANLAATTTAGFKNLVLAQSLIVIPADAAASATVAFDKVAEGSTLNIMATANGKLNSVSISGTVADTNLNGSLADTNVAVTVGKDVQTLAVNSAVATHLSITDGAGTQKLTAIDASASVGAITYADNETTVATITTGAGKDNITVVTATSKTAGSVVDASVTTNAGNDTVTVNVSGDGNTFITTGAGSDAVHVSGRGASVLTVNLGDGADTFTSAVPIAATDKIDAGADSDTLLLSLVGSANVVAFSNFDVYDVKGMTDSLDLDILNTKNIVTEIVGSGALTSAVTLQNLGVGVNLRATGNMGLTHQLALTQKTADTLTITLDADQTANVAGDDIAQVSIAANTATTVSVVFDAAYIGVAGTASGETAATDNISTLALATQAATAISVVSGGVNAKNVLNVAQTPSADGGQLANVTVTGAQALNLSVTDAPKLASIDASAATGGLTASLANLKDGGTVKLGSGTDVITATASSNATNAENIEGLAKTAAVAVSIDAADATAKLEAIAAADKVVIGTAAVADASSSALAATLSKGVLTFTGAGPATLDAALTIADDFTETVGEAVVFQYLGNSYLFAQGASHDVGTPIVDASDILVKLVGVTGITHLVETGTDNFFVV